MVLFTPLSVSPKCFNESINGTHRERHHSYEWGDLITTLEDFYQTIKYIK